MRIKKSFSPNERSTITMSTAKINPVSLLCLNDKILFSRSFFKSHKTFPNFFQRPVILRCNCSSSGSGETETSNNKLKDALAGMMNQQVEDLLSREENKLLLDELNEAAQRVENAKRELAEIEKQELEAKQLRDYVNQLESRAFEIVECQREIVEARAIIDEAERSLSENVDGDELLEKESQGIGKDRERLESIKAAGISAVVGTIAGLPISFAQVTSVTQLILPLAINFISCALFGVTFRYTIRRDLDNIQLKTGTAAAFAFVKGLAVLSRGLPLELTTESISSHAFDGAVSVSENLLVFVFAAVSLDFCFKMQLLNPFPIRSLSK